MKKKLPVHLIVLSVLMLADVMFSAVMLSHFSLKCFFISIIPAIIICIAYIA